MEFLIYTADGDYFCIAYGEQDRERMLRAVIQQTHREGYARVMPQPEPITLWHGPERGEQECSSKHGLVCS